MGIHATQIRQAVVALTVLAAALVLSGCGGGGGTPTVSPTGRSFQFSSGGQTFAMSIDINNRFTVAAIDPTTLPSGSGGQGTVSSSGQFYAQSADGAIQFNGAVSSNAGSAAGTVQHNGQTLFTFTAPVATPGTATPTALDTTFTGTSGTTRAILTVDASSHGTIWVQTASSSGGGIVNVTADGTFTSSDGKTAGRITGTASNFDLTVTKLDGAVSAIHITGAPAARAKWTFIVYLNAANDLQNFGPLNVNQMEKIGSNADVNVVVQWKQADIRRVAPSVGLPSFIGTRRYRITQDSDTSTVSSTLVQDMGANIDMGDWRTLRDFVTWSQTQYPADHYAVVIWNHGAGWRPTRAAGNKLETSFPRSVSIDDDKNTEIQTWQLPQSLSTGTALDMVVFDASLMQMAEVAYEIRNSASIVVGSEESPPGEGYVYNTFLGDLTTNPNMTPTEFSTAIVTRTLQSYGTSGNNTQSAIDLSKMQNVADKLNLFANALQLHVQDDGPAALLARTTADSYAYSENKDLWHYAQLIKANVTATDLKTAATNVQTAITDCMIAERHGSSHSNSHGLAIYVPTPSGYLSSYSNLALSRVTNWAGWLQNQPQ